MTSPPILRRTAQLANHLARSMSSSATTPLPAAPWRGSFLSHLAEMESPSFVLSTLHPDSTSSPATKYLPRARTVIYRGMWAGLDPNPKNSAELNPTIYESDLPTITSDVRMEKIPELFGTASHGLSPSQRQSGSGGPVEAVIWASENKTQWRLRGTAYVIGPDIDAEDGASVRAALLPHMRAGNGDTASWSWARELTAQFGNLSPTMRGTFRNPPPGTPLSENPEEGLGLGQKVMDLQDNIARSNFRVIVIVPDEVDQVDLTNPERGRRWNYRLQGQGSDASWLTTELWP